MGTTDMVDLVFGPRSDWDDASEEEEEMDFAAQPDRDPRRGAARPR
jgi:hypothetical protein